MRDAPEDPNDTHHSELGVSPTRERQAELEERIHKLETALAERNSAALTEDAVAERVIAKLSSVAGLPQSSDGTDRVLVLASKPDDHPPPPKGAVLHPPEMVNDPTHRTWFLTELLAEFRLALHMYFDPRYRISRTTQFAIPGIAILFVLNYLFYAWINIPFLSPVAERAIDILLCVVGYKLIIRELGRYRDVLNYLARYGHRGT
jgi:hypothetical protein